MKIANGKQLVVVDILRAYMFNVEAPQLKSEIIAGIRATHPELGDQLIIQAVDYLRSRRGELTGSGPRKTPRYILTSKAVKLAADKEAQKQRAEQRKRERGEVVRPFVVGIRDPLTPRDYDLRAGMNLAMLIRR